MQLRIVLVLAGALAVGACGSPPGAYDEAPNDFTPDAPTTPPAACTTSCPGEASCVDLSTDTANCGACGAACSAPNHASATCSARTCGFTCHAGYARVDDACVLALAPPRPVAPLSGSVVARARPTLRWALSPLTDGAAVDLCPTRACDHDVVTADVRGDTFAPDADLAPGVHYWRLRARAGHQEGKVSGPVWELFVGRASTDVDSAGGAVLDLDGDGYADVAVADGASGTVSVYRGGPSGAAAAPVQLATPHVLTVASAGDVDGDGFPDLAVSATEGASLRDGSALSLGIYRGGPSGPRASPSYTLTPVPNPANQDTGYGSTMSSGGDLDGDGYADLLVGSSGNEQTYVYPGAASGPSDTRRTTIDSPGASESFGATVAGVGDVDGDGYDDFVVGATGGYGNAAGMRGAAYLYMGAPGDVSTTPAEVLEHPDVPDAQFGAAVAGGDLDGDGYADVVVGAPGATSATGAVYVYRGGATGVSATPVATLLGQDGPNTNFGYAVAAGDLDGDGRADIVVGAPGELDLLPSKDLGHAYVYLGATGALVDAPAVRLTGPDGESFGYALAATGDVDGDGRGDVAIGTYSAERVYLFDGADGGVGATPAATLVGPDTQYDTFGNALALGLGRAWTRRSA